MNHVLLNLSNMSYLSHEKLLLCLDIELHDLAVLELDEIDLISHPLNIIDAVA